MLATVRDAIGADKLLGFRIVAADDRPAAEAATVQRRAPRHWPLRFVSTGSVDVLNAAWAAGAPDYCARTSRSYRYPPGSDLPLSAAIRRAIGAAVPVVGVGRILTPEQGEPGAAAR